MLSRSPCTFSEGAPIREYRMAVYHRKVSSLVDVTIGTLPVFTLRAPTADDLRVVIRTTLTASPPSSH